MIQTAYDAYVDQVCPCILVVHSQAGKFAFTAALHNPSKIKAIVAVEPSGSPDISGGDISKLKTIPHLFVFGDHLTGPFWEAVVANARHYRNLLAAGGVNTEFISLPERGIFGNSHMMMMDRNSDRIADIIIRWLQKNIPK